MKNEDGGCGVGLKGCTFQPCVVEIAARKGLQLTSSDASFFTSGFQSECIMVEVDPCFRMIISQMEQN